MARLRSRKGFRGNPSTGFKIKARGIPFPPSGVAGNGMPPDPGQPDPGATPGSEGGLPNPSVTITPAESHLVKAGDTLWDIAQSHGTTVNDIMAKNQGQNAGYANISDMGLIYPGQRIFIRSAAFPAGATRSPSGDVGDQPVPDPDEDDPVPYWFNEDLYGDNLGAADVGDEDDPGATEEGDLGPGEDDSVVGGTDEPTDPDTGQRAGGGPTGGFASAQDFVDAQKAAGWQWYEDNVWKSGQANPHGEVRDIPPQTYDPNLLEGRWDELQNMAFIVREAAALGEEGAMAQYGWGADVFDVAEQYLQWYGEDFVGPAGTGSQTDTTGTTSGTGMPLGAGETARTSGDGGKLIDEYAWEPDTYTHTERDMGAGYELDGGHAGVESYWIPYVPTTVNAQTVYLATANAMLPFLSQTDRYYLGHSLWAYNDQAFANYQTMMPFVPGAENWDDYFNVGHWRSFGNTLKNLISVLNKQPGHDPELKGSALAPLRWLSVQIDTMQAMLGGGTTNIEAEAFLSHYVRAIAEAKGRGYGGFDQILQMMVRPDIPGEPGFWEGIMKEQDNPVWGY